MLIRFLLSRWRERLCTTKLYAASSSFFLCLFIQLLILHTLSSTSLYTHMLLLLSCYERWLSSVLISPTFTHSKRIFIYIAHITNDVVVNVFFFSLLLFSLSLSYVDSYLFRFVQERRRNTTSQRSAWINFFILSSMHVCVCVLPLTSTHFFLYILSIFPFFTPFCNRQMKVKKRMHWIHTSFQGRWGQASPRIVDDILPSSLFFFFSIYLSFSLFLLSLYMIRLCLLILCVQTAAATAGFRPFTTILCRPSFCTLHPIYTI